MKVLVLGATGGSGRAAVEELLAAGHDVTVLVRRPEALTSRDRVRVLQGDATRFDDVERAVAGQDAVVVTLGIRENPFLVRLRGSKATPIDVRSAGTRNVVAAMRKHGVRKLVVQTSFGVGDTREKLPRRYRFMFDLLLRPQIADTEKQERVVKESGLDWVLAQPVNLTDAEDQGKPFVSTAGETRRLSVSRRKVGRFLAEAVTSTSYVGKTVALSAE